MRKFDFSVRKQYVAPRKIYAIDNGIANHIAVKFSQDRGHYLENAVYLHLRRKNHEMYYYMTKEGHEVDFAVREGIHVSHLYQVAIDLSNEETKKREIRAMTEAMGECHLSDGYIITEHTREDIGVPHGVIHCVPAYEFLLS